MNHRHLTESEKELIDQIAARAVKLWGLRRAASSTIQNLIISRTAALHIGPDGPLDLAAFLAAPDQSFMHDSAGILASVDPMTGRCADFFVPRFVRRSPSALAAMAGLSELPEGQGGEQ